MKFEEPKQSGSGADLGSKLSSDGMSMPRRNIPDPHPHEELFGKTKLSVFGGAFSVITPSVGWNAAPSDILDFRAAVGTAILSAPALIIDLGGASLGSGKVRLTGLAELLNVYQTVSAAGGRVALAVEPLSPVMTQLCISNINQALKMFSSLSDAKASIASGS